MNFLRNREIRHTLLLLLFIGIAATALAFLWSPRFGLLMAAVSALFLLIYTASTWRRYQRICDLSAEIDRILHGEEPSVPLSAYKEGELAVLQSELHKMTERLLEQSRKLQEDKVYLADMIADISHQIRTPLTSINLILSFLREPDLSQARRLELTRELLQLTTRIDWLITTLLKLSRLDAGTVRFQVETIPLEQLLRQAAEPILVPMELRDQTLTTEASGRFTGDVGWTVEAIGNIIKNCVEHTPAGGRIELRGSETPLYTEITVADNGSGIDPKDLPHIFDRFYKGSQAGETGFGIGLALARSIITAQSGTIKAENRPEKGAIFTIRFYKSVV